MNVKPYLTALGIVFLVACNPETRNFDTSSSSGPGGQGGQGGSAGQGGQGGGAGGGDICPAGFANCDASPDCETTVTDNPLSCGGCGIVCIGACIGTTCNDPIHISAGFDHTCAITALGDLYCWGRNVSREIGVGSSDAMVLVPTKVPTAGPVRNVALGGVLLNGNPPTEYAHTCAVLQDTTVQCWGSNSFGELGIGSGGWQDKPSTVVSLVKAAEISAGGRHTCAITENQELLCWGANDVGQLGIGQVGPEKMAPTSVVAGVKMVSTGIDHSCAIMTAGDLVCWGKNGWGRLGNGSQNDEAAPIVVSLTGVERISAGREHTCAIKAGAIYCWGNGYQGQLGIENEFSWREKPTDPSSMPPANLVAAGWQHTVGIAAGDGQAYGWGVLTPIGDGGTAGDYVPKPSGFLDVVEIAVGRAHTCALTKTGRIYCWGDNQNGQMGTGIAAGQELLPVEVSLP